MKRFQDKVAVVTGEEPVESPPTSLLPGSTATLMIDATFKFVPSQYGPMNKSYDLFGDESIIWVYLPGNTQGLAGTLIQNDGRFVLLTADCGYACKSWERMILPYHITTRQEIVASFE
ncbi:MAG TPA: hypothetical protein PK344_06460 [Syntrophorhabdaceae bacterium]|nr:hypothetical protein [Syntrophorhabdaceae bacterium]HPA07266.1 hypothetical protein [Methanoregulaceae archaeon]